MEVAFLPILNKVFQFCIEHPKEVQSAVNVLPMLGGFIKEMFSGSQPVDKKIGDRKVVKTSVRNQPRESLKQWINSFPSERGSRRRYPNLEMGSIVDYSGAFGNPKLNHYGVYLGKGRVMQFTGGRDAGSLSGEVEILLLSEFEKQAESEVRVINHDKLKNMKAKDILTRARDEYCKAKSEQVYDPANNNCQHLAYRVAANRNYSPQVEEIEQQIGTAVSNYVTKSLKDRKVTSVEAINVLISEAAGWVAGYLVKQGVKGASDFVSRKVQSLSESKSVVPQLGKKADDGKKSIHWLDNVDPMEDDRTAAVSHIGWLDRNNLLATERLGISASL